MEVIVVLVVVFAAFGIWAWASMKLENQRIHEQMQAHAREERYAREARERERNKQAALDQARAERAVSDELERQERALQISSGMENTFITSFSVSDGKGIDRKRVIIEATCTADTNLHSRLHLYRSTTLYKFPDAVMAADDAKELTYVALGTGGELRFVDPKVSENEVYYYYIWISSIHPFAFATRGRDAAMNYRFGHCAHTVTYTETIGDLAERKKAVHQARETLDSMKPKPPPKPEPTLAEKTAEAIQKIVAQQRSVKDATDVLAAELPKYGNLTAKEQQIISAKINQFIQNEFKKSTG